MEESLVAVVTGGGTGIGKAISISLSAHSYRVAVNCINRSSSIQDAETVVKEITENYGHAMVIPADISIDTEVKQMMEYVIKRWGRIDVLINNAGKTTFVDFSDLDGLTDNIWSETLSTNLLGPWYTSRAVAKVMMKQGKGKIINIASVSGITHQGSSIAYCASKAAVVSLTKSLARALAPLITVNAIAPGTVKTKWHAGKEAGLLKAKEKTLLLRIGEPKDIAESVLSLLNLSWVTGQVFIIDGGEVI